MATKQWETSCKPRASTDGDHKTREFIKTVEIDTCNTKIQSPSPSKSKPLKLKVRSASPRCLREETCHSPASLISSARRLSNGGITCRYGVGASAGAVPNYMAATESAKARARLESSPRQTPSTPGRERGGSVKKRLAYPAPEPHDHDIAIGCSSSSFSHSLRSPSFKSLQCNGYYGMDNLSSIGRDTSPCSTTDLRCF